MTDTSVGPRSEMQFDTLWVGTETMHEMLAGAAFEPPQGTDIDDKRWVLPDVKVGVVWSKETLAAIVLGAWGFEDEKKAREVKSEKGRESTVVSLETGNHLVCFFVNLLNAMSNSPAAALGRASGDAARLF